MKQQSKLKSEVGVKPLLRWAGSKRRLLPALVCRAPSKFNRYYEPFVGSACLFLELSPKRAVLGDMNIGLMETYRMIRSRPCQVSALLQAMPINEQYYYYIRDVAPNILTATQRVARFIYLNRYCFNGVYRENRQGKFNVPRGVKTGNLPNLDEIQFFRNALKAVDLRTGDFVDCIKDAGKNDFIYLDPPYAVAGARYSGEYGYGGFNSNDLDRLIESLRLADTKGTNILLSYTDSEYLQKAFPKWQIDKISVNRSVSGFSKNRGVVSEVLIRNYR